MRLRIWNLGKCRPRVICKSIVPATLEQLPPTFFVQFFPCFPTFSDYYSLLRHPISYKPRKAREKVFHYERPRNPLFYVS